MTEQILLSDIMISKYLHQFREYIFRFYHIHIKEGDIRKDEVLLIERKYNRKWDGDKIRCIPATPIILEDLPIRRQILLFATHRTIIFRHGSCLANLIFSPPNCRVFDLDHENNRPHIVGRLCELLGLNHFYLDYHSCSNDWFVHPPVADISQDGGI